MKEQGLYPESKVEISGTTVFLTKGTGGEKRLRVFGDATGFDGERHDEVFICPLTPKNAAALRACLPWLQPQPLGLQTSAGFGDRLGLATPGHVRAARRFRSIAAIFAQQSVRENTRAGRTPQQVMDDAMWGVFQAGWRERWGADADHLKTPDDVDAFTAAGYTLYTIDPGDHVDNEAHIASPADVEVKVQALPWDALEDTEQDMERRYLDRSFDLGSFSLKLDRKSLLRAAAKYGRAIAHTTTMYRYLLETMGDEPFELED